MADRNIRDWKSVDKDKATVSAREKSRAQEIKDRLRQEYGIDMSRPSVKQGPKDRRQQMGFRTSVRDYGSAFPGHYPAAREPYDPDFIPGASAPRTDKSSRHHRLSAPTTPSSSGETKKTTYELSSPGKKRPTGWKRKR